MILQIQLFTILPFLVLFYAPTLHATSALSPARRDLDGWITSEASIAMAGLLANVGPAGSKSYGAAPGVVLASPSRLDPDYYYTWTRDSALTLKTLVDHFLLTGDPTVQQLINDYVEAQAGLQAAPNPSGDLASGSGLGEPKFYPNKTAFTGAWGRPQRDGPALRATALIAYGKWLLANGQGDIATNVVWPMVQNDVQYVAQHWNQTGFDLWEEVEGSSFFTALVHRRALIQGSAFALSVGTHCKACEEEEPQLQCFLQSFWDARQGFVRANINSGPMRCGKDANTLLATIHTFDLEAGCNDINFQPCSERMLANHRAVTSAFRSMDYSINRNAPPSAGVAVGRYPEDTYYSGNPWYLTTLAAAEQLYLALAQIEREGSITISNVSEGFWTDIAPHDMGTVSPGTYSSNNQTFIALVGALKAYADSFLDVVQAATPADGSLSEQFDKSTRSPVSAPHLTWSYAAFLTAVCARSNTLPPSWDPSANATASAEPTPTCTPPSQTSASWTYAYSTPTDTSLPKPTACPTPPYMLFTFNVLTQTMMGESIYVSGSIPELGNWDLRYAISLHATWYTDAQPLWTGSTSIGYGKSFEYKYVRQLADHDWIWESGNNRMGLIKNTSPSGACRGSGATKDAWPN